MKTTDYCSYELSKALKACGFNELTNSFYDEASLRQGEFEIVPTYAKFNEVCKTPGCECISAPSLYAAQKWLREKKEIFVEVTSEALHDWDFFVMELDEDANIGVVRGSEIYPSYEQALSAGISAALELIKPAHQ